MTTSNPGSQRRLTRAEYNRLNPVQQGIVSYMQGAWNTDVPEKCPYKHGTKQASEWADGQQRGVMIAQDGDDE